MTSTANRDVLADMERVAGTADDEPFYMVNLLDYHDIADYPQDSEWFGSTGAEAGERYNAGFGPASAALGIVPVFVAVVEESLQADDIQWDVVAIVRYPSRQALLDLNASPSFTAAVEHKHASLANTFAMISDRVDLPSVAEPEPSALPYPPSAEDPGFMMIHVIDFNDQARYLDGEEPENGPISGRDAVDRYSLNAGLVAAPMGVSARAWFEVRATLLGPDRTWHQIRLNEFPSRRTFEALTADPTWAAGVHHREAGINKTYALITNPIVYDRTFGTPQPAAFAPPLAFIHEGMEKPVVWRR